MIPKEWKTETLQNLAKFIDYRGRTPKKTESGIPLITAKNIRDGYIKREPREFIAENDFDDWMTRGIPQVGDVVITTEAPMGNVASIDITEKFAMAQRAICLQFFVKDSNRYFSHCLRSPQFKSLLNTHGTGTTVKGIKAATLKQLLIPLPPLAEQKVIADKLDELLAQVESTKARLDAIPAILKSFRQSVLAAAISGKLTEAWRGDELLNWEAIKLEDAAGILDPQPSHRTPKAVEGGVPYIGIGDLKSDGSIDFENARKVSMDVLKEHNARYQLKKGDFVFGKIGTLGKATILPTDIDYTLSANVILIQPQISLVDASYLMHFLSAPSTMEEVARQSNSTSQAAFGIKKMRAFKCYLPSLEEQTEIVRRVEELFTFADKVEAQVNAAQSRVNNLTQSILAKAFRGELTQEWRAANPELISDDNSAEALLKRIKAERAKAKPAKKASAKKVKA